MADFEGTLTVGAPEQALFDYLSDVRNLPRYFVRMTSAEPGEGEEVHTTAQMPDGHEVRGDAWFRTHPADHSIEWGSEGPSAYRGTLDVSATDGGAQVAIRLHTTRVKDGDPEVTKGIDETLANIKRLVEKQGGG